MEKYFTPGHDIDDSIIRRMRFACWITKATNTHSEYVTLIAFPRQQWLRQRASMLPYSTLPLLLTYYIRRDMNGGDRRAVVSFRRRVCVPQGPLTHHDVMQSRGKWT